MDYARRAHYSHGAERSEVLCTNKASARRAQLKRKCASNSAAASTEDKPSLKEQFWCNSGAYAHTQCCEASS